DFVPSRDMTAAVRKLIKHRGEITGRTFHPVGGITEHKHRFSGSAGLFDERTERDELPRHEELAPSIEAVEWYSETERFRGWKWFVGKSERNIRENTLEFMRRGGCGFLLGRDR